MDINIEPFHPIDASNELLDKYLEFYFNYLKERDPDDPLPSKDYIKHRYRKKTPQWVFKRWIVFNKGSKDKIIAASSCVYTVTGATIALKKKDRARIRIIVAKNFRNQGIGTKLLKIITSELQKTNKRVIETTTSFDSGRRFCEKFDGKLITESTESRLYLRRVDWRLINQWRIENQQRNPEVSIELFTKIPEKDIEEFCELYTEVTKQEPSEKDYQLIMTPELRRQREQQWEQENIIWETMITRESTGAISGITEISIYQKGLPTNAYQGFTGVREKYRGRGLGKWLKAEMLTHIQNNYPKVKLVITDNTNINAPMLSINRRMGFQFYKKVSEYTFEINQLAQKFGIKD
ncbi:MAG: GNAT family N-acetyltransferase [Candidatus Heimdallarchaeota archaeon]|nr:GNAT family N-acetyltransferase [Candidatus Heimdallarchaeota archaeon]